MAITFVRSDPSLALSTNTVTINTGAPPSAGDLIIIPIIWTNNLTVSTITDSAGNTFVQAPGAYSAGSGAPYQTDIWYCKNCLAGAAFYNVIVTMSGTAFRLRASFTEWAGANTIAPLDGANNIAGPSASVSPTITPTQTGQLLLACISANNNAITSRNAPWTALPDYGPGGADEIDYVINPALSTQQVVWQPTTAQDFGSSVASFFAPATGPSNAVKSGMFLVIP